MAAAAGRGAPGGLDRRAAAPPAGRTVGTAAVVGVGVRAAHKAAGAGEAGHAAGVVHRAGVHSQRLVRGGHHPGGTRRQAGARQVRTEGGPGPFHAAAVTGYRTCLDCPAPVKFGDRARCHVCHRRVTRAALKRRCPNCDQLRHLGESGVCAICERGPVPGRPAKTIACARCGEQRRNAWQGVCTGGSVAAPDRPFRYSAAMAGRLHPVPAWWDELTAFAAARHPPGGAIVILREAGRLLGADPDASPQQLLDRCAPATGTAGRALRAFFTSRGLTLPGDEKQRRAAARRRRHLDAVPDCLAAAVAAFNHSQLAEHDRAGRTRRHPQSNTTLETSRRIFRDLAAHLTPAGPVTGWSQVPTADLEGFLGHSPGNRHQKTYVLRGFFGWAKHRKLILIDPAAALRLGSQPAFTGTVLDAAAQRALFRRWAGSTAHPHERLTRLLALLHAASSAQIRSLTTGDADYAQRTLSLAGRPFPAPLARVCRQPRVPQWATAGDPKLPPTALGMCDAGLARSLAGTVDSDRLERTPSIGRQPTRALQARPCTP